MDYPTLPSLISRPPRRQRRVSQDAEDQSKLGTHLQQSSNGTNIEAKSPVTPRALTVEFMKLLHYNDTLVIPALKLLDLYSSLWECYVIKSAEKMQFEDKQRQLLESNEWLASDSDILLQLCDEQAMELRDRKLALQALCNDHDLDLDLHAICYAGTRNVYIGSMFVGGNRRPRLPISGSTTPLVLCIIVIDYVYELVGKPTFGLPPFVTINYEQKHGISGSWTMHRIGVTSKSDDQIHEAAQETISKMPQADHVLDNNCQHFVVNLADAILRDPRHKYLSVKGQFISAHEIGVQPERSEPTQDEQNFKGKQDFQEDGDIEEGNPVPITDRDAEGAVIENEKERRKMMLKSIADFMADNTPLIQERE
ncbi:Pc16g15010 [Penicillium rubens Wisconsin 54-1255]|uniref:Pc16g15010 protein n=1 Tax=Penicillium rubens (strain ATCC 28089 / DSM 1075 / NRRL 1951 / Wisconsin 54-1255) TaxID=500485 RepID=B6HA44_PENRW|nr:Pc16g15010 [Penicillium rubens Wisconsin 54-1255]